jgi:hypothetical protein
MHLHIKVSNNCHCWLLQAHAASAVLNFSENCTPDILTPYLDVIVTKLLVLLQVYDHPHHQPTLSMCSRVYLLLFDYRIQKCLYGTLNIFTEDVLGHFDFLSFFSFLFTHIRRKKFYLQGQKVGHSPNRRYTRTLRKNY